MNIVIKTPKFIGDTIMMLPAMELLRQHYKDAKFTIVCPETCVDIFRKKGISKFIIDRGKNNRVRNTKQMIKQLRKEHYSLGVVFHNTFLDALIFKLSKIDTIIGYDKERRKILLDFWLKIDRSRHYVNHYANLVNQYLGNKYTTLPTMSIFTEPSKLIETNNKITIGFLLGGESKGTRAYPQNLSMQLLKELKEKNYSIVLIGDKYDNTNNKIYQHLLENEKIEVRNLSGKTSIAEYIDLIGSINLLVTIDSSAMHIAAATGTPFIVLRGKGTSAFDTVYPKVEFGTVIYSGKNKIQDSDIIKSIKPAEIARIIERVSNVT